MITMTFHNGKASLKVEEEDVGTQEAWFATTLLFLIHNRSKAITDLLMDVDPEELVDWYAFYPNDVLSAQEDV